jgi:hypothetical protein
MTSSCEELHLLVEIIRERSSSDLSRVRWLWQNAAMLDQPTGTFLVADLEGSTRLRAALAAKIEAALSPVDIARPRLADRDGLKAGSW